MDRVRYMEDRERALNERVPLSPEYSVENQDVFEFRAICIDRIWRISALASAFDGAAASAAVRLFDRCMSKMSKKCMCKANMLLLAMASFDICYKMIEGDLRTPGLYVYYYEGYSCKFMESKVPFERFPETFRDAEIQVLKVVSGEPNAPTAVDYIHECCRDWAPARVVDKVGRRVLAAIAAYTYCIDSTSNTSEEIAAAAVWLALASGREPWPTAELALLCSNVPQHVKDCISQKMAKCMTRLFKLAGQSMMYYYFRDVYEDWCTASKRFVAPE